MSSEVLDARRDRWLRRLSLARSLGPGGSILTLTLRLPAALRLNGAYESAARTLFAGLEDLSRGENLPTILREFRIGADGPEGYLALRCGGLVAKKLALRLEDGYPWGALADVDAMDSDGRVVGRSDLGLGPRSCLVCGGTAAVCSAGAVHDIESVEAAVKAILTRSSPDSGAFHDQEP